jgi:hypothetical protein
MPCQIGRTAETAARKILVRSSLRALRKTIKTECEAARAESRSVKPGHAKNLLAGSTTNGDRHVRSKPLCLRNLQSRLPDDFPSDGRSPLPPLLHGFAPLARIECAQSLNRVPSARAPILSVKVSPHPENCKNVETDRRRPVRRSLGEGKTAREGPLAFRALAQGVRDRTATPGTTAVACGRRQPLDMVQAAQAGAGRGQCPRFP